MAAYPFCTIDPNRQVVPVPDPPAGAAGRAFLKPERLTPTTINFVDVAGLISGASKGEGLGNHCSDGSGGNRPHRSRGALLCQTALFPPPGGAGPSTRTWRWWKPNSCSPTWRSWSATGSNWKSAGRPAMAGGQRACILVTRVAAGLNQGRWARDLSLLPADLALLTEVPLLTLKPYIFVGNVAKPNIQGGPLLAALEELGRTRRAPVVPSWGTWRRNCWIFPPRSKRNFSRAWGWPSLASTALSRRATGFLGLVTFYSVGPEVRAWTVPAARRPGRRPGSFRHGEGFYPGRGHAIRRPSPPGVSGQDQGSRTAGGGRQGSPGQGREILLFQFQEFLK